MKLAICNTKNWFHLNDEIVKKYEILNIKNKSDLTLSKLDKFKPDFVFFPHWHWIVEKEIFTKFTCIVFHTSPLPYGRGGSPIQNLIIKGYKSAPVCAIKMSDGLDNGPIYNKKSISLKGTLSEILARINFAINDLIKGLILHLPNPKPQSGEVVTFKRLGHKNNEIRSDETYEDIYNKIRMLDEDSYPSAFINLNNVLIEFSEITNEDGVLLCKAKIKKKEQS